MAARHEHHSLHGVNLWLIPVIMSFGALALFGLTDWIDTLANQKVLTLPTWCVFGSIDDARAFLSATMGAVSTVLALIFSVALLVLSMVASLFGPRLLYRFVQDWVTQVTIGLFLATFIYILLIFIVTHSDTTGTFVPQVSLFVSAALVLISFGFLVFYSHRVASSIQNPDMVAGIVGDFARALDSTVQTARGNRGEEVGPDVLRQQCAEGAAVVCSTSGYMQEIEHVPLLQAAAAADAIVHVMFRPGQFVLRGEVVARVWPAERLDALVGSIKRNVKIGQHRVLDQDVEFGIAQIVEIGIRALSPAINDTYTGLACVDYIGDALIILAESPVQDGCWYDSSGKLRLRHPALPFQRAVKEGCDQMRQASLDSPAVMIRMLTVLARVGGRVNDADGRSMLLRQATTIWETASARIGVQSDLKDIEAAWLRTRDTLESPVLVSR